jgi:hypothetical protein
MTDRSTAEDRRRERFRALPEQVRPADWVETVDSDSHPPLVDEDDARDRMLRSTNWP